MNSSRNGIAAWSAETLGGGFSSHRTIKVETESSSQIYLDELESKCKFHYVVFLAIFRPAEEIHRVGPERAAFLVNRQILGSREICSWASQRCDLRSESYDLSE